MNEWFEEITDIAAQRHEGKVNMKERIRGKWIFKKRIIENIAWTSSEEKGNRTKRKRQCLRMTDNFPKFTRDIRSSESDIRKTIRL